jgi:SpoIID/LytB domain protein
VRRRTQAAAGALGLLLLTPIPLPRADAAVPVLVIDGKGFGHGVGMAQDGAYWMGKAGSTTPQILAQFYPGTKVGKASGAVRVNVLTPADGQAVVAFPNGGEVRDAPDGAQSAGFPVRVGPGGQVRLRFDGSRYIVEGGTSTSATAAPASTQTPTAAGSEQDPEPGVTPQQLPTTSTTESTTTTTSPPPSSTTTTATTQPPAGPPPPPPGPSGPQGPSSTRTLWAVPGGSAGTTTLPARARRYRGVIEATAQRGPFRLVNQVDVEHYLRGMGEVRNPSWPPAALRAQATAARTYALRAMAANGELCDDTRCQVYLGAQAEYAAMDKAVADTRGQVVAAGKTLASTVYSANGGGFSASRQEGFGSPDDGAYPYLRPAPYPTQDPSPWTVRVALTDVAARLAYRGALSGVAVSATGPSGRATEVRLDGASGSKAVTGIAFAKALSLKSTLFTLRADTADTAPAPPPPGEGLQAPPEAAGPVFDPNVLPPDPLTPDEFTAIPSPDAFTAAPERDVRARIVPPDSTRWPWASLAAFSLLAVGGTAGGLHFARRR